MDGEVTTIIISGGIQDGVGGFASAFGNGMSLNFKRVGDSAWMIFHPDIRPEGVSF